MNMVSVVPLVGTWIEITQLRRENLRQHVVPLVGTWIEIILEQQGKTTSESCPSWARGLKWMHWHGSQDHLSRAPYGHTD